MPNIHVQNWRDKRGSEIEKAQAFVKDKNNNLTEASKLIGISLPALYAYRADPDKLLKASWTTVNKLSQLADIKYIQNTVSDEEMQEFLQILDGLFNKMESQNQDYQSLIEAMKHIIMTDPLAVTKLFETDN